MPTYPLAPNIAMPARAHTLTKSARQAVEAVKAHGRRRREAALVTEHDRINVEHPVPASATRLVKAATAAGYEVEVGHGFWLMNAGASNERKAPAVRVIGLHRGKRVGFQSIWVDGKAKLGLWHDMPGVAAHDVGVSIVAEKVGAR
jgi:hypothetical protein